MKPITLLIALCAIGNAALAEEKSISLPIKETHERLIVSLWEGNITIAPGSGDAITLVADCASQKVEVSADDQGFRSLRSSAMLPDIVSSDDVITINTYEYGPQCTVRLAVPEQLHLHTRINRSGSIQIEAWRGTLLAWSADGDVSVANFGGSLSVTAMNGDANVSLADAGIEADSAITAANGTLTLSVNPSSVPALRAQARWGDVQTNLELTFDEVVDGGSTWFVTDADDEHPVMTLRNLNQNIVIRTVNP